MYGNVALSISSSSFTSCYTSAKVSAMLGVMVHGAVRVGCHACMRVCMYLWWSLQSSPSPPDELHGRHLHAQRYYIVPS